jgi:ubiquinone/menaquinone biosynthesis C-methylase UbiE
MKHFGLIKQMIQINGIQWVCAVVFYVLIRKLDKDFHLYFLDRYIKTLEKRKNLPGMNCVEMNSLIWNSWNWEKSHGEEWTKSQAWKQSLVKEVMLKFLKEEQTVVEIGPGGGKWTEYLQKFAKNLIVVDISEKCIEVCKKRFSNCNNITYFVNDGSDLSFLSSGSIDFIWSFDVFVHISPADIDKYIHEFKRILKRRGTGIIHHAGEGSLHGGWRSSMTKELFSDILQKNNLKLIAQIDSWGTKGQFDVKYYHDTI